MCSSRDFRLYDICREFGGMVERFKTAPWKGVGPQKGSVGSNPTSTATLWRIYAETFALQESVWTL